MWEAMEMGNEDFLWAGIAFMGGIGGDQQAPCGAVSSAAIFLGLQNRCPSTHKQKAKQGRNVARRDAGEYIRSFREKFGRIACGDLVGMDFSEPEEYRKFLESGLWKNTCEKYVGFTIEKLYELDERNREEQKS